MTVTVGSLCTGVGGLEMAVASLWPDSSLSWVMETAAHPSAVLAQRFPGVPNLGSAARESWLNVPRVDVIVGGIPCQPYSRLGSTKGVREDPRDLLWIVPGLLRRLQPRLLLLENVPELLLSPRWAQLEVDLRRLGFDARSLVLSAAEIGACHQRRRAFIAIVRRGDTLSGLRSALSAPPEALPEPVSGHLLPTPTANRGRSTTRKGAKDGYGATLLDVGFRSLWKHYQAAISAQEAWHGPAPTPSDGRRGVNPAFADWMMGWPPDWTAAIPYPVRRLQAIGNGCVPQQAAEAYRRLLGAL